MEIFKLFGSILVDTDKAEKSIQKTDDDALNLGKTLAAGAKKAGEFGMAIATGAAAAGTAILGVANDAATVADEVDKASIRMGVSAEYFQELRYAAESSGVAVSDMEKAAKKLEGTDLNLDEAMAQIYAFGTEEERAAQAAEVFGESIAYSMAPMLQMSGEEFDGMRARANELGLVISNDAVKAGVVFGDTMADIAKSLKALVTQIGAAVMPTVQKFADMILKFLPTVQSIMDKLIPVIVELADAAMPPLMDMIEQILPVMLNLVQEIMPFLSDLISAVLPIMIHILIMIMPYLSEIISTVLPIMVELLKILTPVLDMIFTILSPLLQLVLSLITPLLSIINDILTPIIKLLDSLIKGRLSILVSVLEDIAKVVTGVFKTALDVIMFEIDTVIYIFQDFIDFISKIFAGDWEAAWNDVVNTFSIIFGGIVDVAKVPINAIIKMLNSAIDGINKIKIPDWVPGLGGKNLNLQKIPLLAKGGVADEDGMAMVGEAGPELLHLPQGASVHPLSGNNALIDYDKLGAAFLKALQTAAPEFATNIRVEGNKDNLVEILMEENEKSIYSTGRPLFG